MMRSRSPTMILHRPCTISDARRSRWTLFLPTCSLLLLASTSPNAVVVVVASNETDGEPPYGTCGSCHCIPSSNGTDPCPSGEPGVDVPQGPPWDNGTVIQFESLIHNNPMTMKCDPYNETACPEPLDPPQDPAMVALGDDAVCAIKYSHDDAMSSAASNKTCPRSYDLETYASSSLASADGAYITHFGACGACSSTQDLAAYMRYTDLTSEGSECVIKGLTNPERGVQCFMDIGYTRPCAEMWMYNGFESQRSCLVVCTQFLIQQRPNNGPPPLCTLDECLQCDEDNAGPIFTQVAARSRRRSGMLSYIVRPCEDILIVNHVDPCDATDAPTSAPTGIPSVGNMLKVTLLSSMLGLFFSMMAAIAVSSLLVI